MQLLPLRTTKISYEVQRYAKFLFPLILVALTEQKQKIDIFSFLFLGLGREMIILYDDVVR